MSNALLVGCHCQLPSSGTSCSCLSVSEVLYTDYIVPPMPGGVIKIQGLEPELIVSNFTFDAGDLVGELPVFIADRKVILVSVGFVANVYSSNVASKLLVNKLGNGQLTNVDLSSPSVGGVGIALAVGDVVSVVLTGGVPTNLDNGVLTLTFNVV